MSARTRRGSCLAVQALCALLVFGLESSGRADPGDVNPSGWIRAGGWNMLFPLGNPYGCDGGGAATMLGSWLAPHDLAQESPAPGEIWSDIDFGGEALATAFEAAQLYGAIAGNASPRWVSVEVLEGLGLAEPGLDCDAPAFFGCDLIDYEAFVERYDDFASDFSIPFVARENVLGVAQTFVENRTGQPLCVDLCTASDDALQVWLNDKLILNRSVCRAADPDCSERTPALLEAGRNKITVLVWQGVGDWSFRLGLVDPETGKKLSNKNQDQVAFLGALPSAIDEQTLEVRRSVENPDCCPVANPIRVVLQGNGKGSGTVRLTEWYRPTAGATGTISNVSHGGVVTTVEDGPFITWNVAASVLGSTGVYYDVALAPGAAGAPLGTVNDCALVAGEAEVKGSLAHTGRLGVFDDSHDIGRPADLAAGPGSLTATAGPDEMLGTADDVYTIQGSGNDVWDGGDSFHFAYVRVRGDFRATVRVTSRTFPASGGRWGRYGLMARKDCAPNSKYSLVHANLEADPGAGADHVRGDGVFWQLRRNHRVDAPNVNSGYLFPDPDMGGPHLVNQPSYFRLERRGEVLSGYASFDGASWKLVGSDAWQGLAADDELLVGFMHSKHQSASNPGRISFTQFQVGPPPRIEQFDNQDGRQGRVVYSQDFDTTPAGTLPSSMQGNCGAGCGGASGFSPRVMGGRLRLTQEGSFDNATSAFIKTPVPAGTGAIVVEYTVYMSHSGIPKIPPAGDPNPADGVTLTLMAGRDTGRVGAAGGGLGYSGIHHDFNRAAPSFSVEVDTWAAQLFNERSGAPANDAAWHLGINNSGSVHSVAVSPSPLPDCWGPSGVRFRVVYRSEGKVSVYVVGGQGAGAGAGDEQPIAEAQVDPLSNQGDTDAVVGFTGSTGGASETGEIDDVVVTVVDCNDSQEVGRIAGPETAGKGALVVLDAGGSTAGTGDAGEPLAFKWMVSGDGAIEGADDGPTVILRTGSPVGDGEVIGRVFVDDRRCAAPVSSTAEHKIRVTSGGGRQVTYDANGDGKMDLSDAVFHLSFLFSGGRQPACLEALDFNGDQRKDISDPIAELTFLFGGGLPPAKGMGCQTYATCAAGPGCP
ncbi:MAG: hypothetical protein HY721_11275 [Planctomycetes bacterium]|nr:hypothetical protein [Planctomycetota bacterium]